MSTFETLDLVGTWRLVSISAWVNGALHNPEAMGPNPAGYITYTRSGQVQVVIDLRRRSQGASIAESPIFAYAGPYRREGDTVIHHLEMCTRLQDIGGEYVRTIEADGEDLVLGTVPVERDGQMRVSKLKWTRVA